ncbi:hypothetical protein FKV75_03815 [Weissella paramesenteroides]|uniref:hypothetical protein n=1 Tax=Weissella paramesenteroides TaxID=1249 RepID=UPI00123A056D|nr:hypothetical protein [Weissella paramesenteroides]KAA8440445.1 hypothetical protein FKV77_08190 [Weissella paramesenteroides]KAA8440964.1 hypothetical protein FKV81_04790 [Weissella paramesenteroides]KAA8443395.1 hypothetical protein FKV75_03815 [Weissella paramesenteroides]KAA8447684.1 hypothetical protein FKV76_04035 [Weissella paramesenteroides]KAA8449713.1 hypothetical protein FKV74_05880 [Weissella paramesenteroides]
MKQSKGIDKTVINKDTSVIYSEDVRLTQIKQIKNQQDVFDKELDRISEDLTFTMVALCIVAVLLLIAAIFLIFVINRVGI